MKVISAYYNATEVSYTVFKRVDNKLVEVEKNQFFTGKVSSASITKYIQQEVDKDEELLGFNIVSITHPRKIAKFPPHIVKKYTKEV